MFSWFRKRKNKKQSNRYKRFYCKTFGALTDGTTFEVAGKKYKKQERNWLSPIAVDLVTGEEVRMSGDILCMVYLES